jgi:alpha-glucoside transport system substrate-binding protein
MKAQVLKCPVIQSALEMSLLRAETSWWARNRSDREELMKKSFYAGAAILALTAGMASAEGHLAGEQVTVFGPWLGPDQAAVEEVLAGFAAASGADVRYVGSDSFEQQIMVDAEAGSAPNVAVFPQPGLAADMARAAS